jgi:hypothetical protein
MRGDRWRGSYPGAGQGRQGLMFSKFRVDGPPTDPNVMRCIFSNDELRCSMADLLLTRRCWTDTLNLPTILGIVAHGD